jgi:hypothetical protein
VRLDDFIILFQPGSLVFIFYYSDFSDFPNRPGSDFSTSETPFFSGCSKCDGVEGIPSRAPQASAANRGDEVRAVLLKSGPCSAHKLLRPHSIPGLTPDPPLLTHECAVTRTDSPGFFPRPSSRQRGTPGHSHRHRLRPRTFPTARSCQPWTTRRTRRFHSGCGVVPVPQSRWARHLANGHPAAPLRSQHPSRPENRPASRQFVADYLGREGFRDRIYLEPAGSPRHPSRVPICHSSRSSQHPTASVALSSPKTPSASSSPQKQIRVPAFQR